MSANVQFETRRLFSTRYSDMYAVMNIRFIYMISTSVCPLVVSVIVHCAFKVGLENDRRELTSEFLSTSSARIPTFRPALTFPHVHATSSAFLQSYDSSSDVY